MATAAREEPPFQQSRAKAKVQRYLIISLFHIVVQTRFIASFQTSPPTLTVDYHTSRRTLTDGDLAEDDGAICKGMGTNSSIFDARSILGETLDISLQNGKYSWNNPNAAHTEKGDVRSSSSSSINKFSTTLSYVSSSTKNIYKRVQFPGCGSILLHQQPDAFLEPNTVDDDENTSGIKRRQRQKGRTGVTLWSASHVISNYIDMQWSKGGAWCSCTDNNSRWVVLELGAGLGLCSAVAAKHGMDVISTDNDPTVLSLLKENLKRNQSTYHPSKQQVHAHSLDWATVASDPNAHHTHPVFVQLESISGVDLIVLSDVIYGATQPSWGALLVLLNKLRSQRHRLRSEPCGDPIVLLGYTQRRRDMSPLDEARFFAKVKAAGMEAVLIPSSSIPHGEKYMLTSLFELRWVDDADS
jgi:hypothetical protein